MTPITDSSEVLAAIDQAKTRAPAFQTNFFPDRGKMRQWITRRDLWHDTRQGVAFFLRRDGDFWHLYFCAPDPERLGVAIPCLPWFRSEQVTVDLIGKEPALASLRSLLTSVGFREYTRLFRMARLVQGKHSEADRGEDGVEYGTRADSELILEQLRRSFDPYAENLPSRCEIEAALEGHEILIARRGGEVAGLLFFQTQGLTSTLRYWLVSEPFRKQRLGAALIHRYFAASADVQRFMLWVVSDNENAIGKYSHYGFAPDGLVDQVLVNERIPDGTTSAHPQRNSP